jgi:ADP-heptose:LPS heptosyltransferase
LKILIIRFSSIGDIVLTSPVLRCLKKKFPDAEVHFLTKAQYHPLLIANPHINKFYLLDNDNLDMLITDMQAENYDVVIDMHKNIRTLKVKSALKVKQTFSYNKLNFEKWLKVNFKLDMLPEKHIVDRYFEALEPLGIENDGEGLDYYIWEREIYDSMTKLTNTTYVAFAIGANTNTKKLPEDKIIEICSKITQKIYLLGGKKEEAVGKKINERFPAQIVNLCGKLTINESAFIVKHAKKVITHDTGMMHIAAAFKKPIISVWGNTVPGFGMYPYYGERNKAMASTNSTIFEVKGLSCRPCSKIGYEHCPKGHFKCMNDQDVEGISNLANRI